MHNSAFNAAWKALELENASYNKISALDKFKSKQIQAGDTKGATTTEDRIKNLIQNRRPLN